MFECLKAARAEAVWDALAEHVRPGRVVECATVDALHLTLARDALARNDYPPFDRSIVDGYAVRAADLEGGKARLRRIALVRAGDAQPSAVEPGTCVQINTGAPLPPHADAVVMVENCTATDGGFCELEDLPSPGQHIERFASLLKAGDTLVPRTTRITVGALAALISAGITSVSAFRPRATLLSTGDELVSAGATLQHGQIFDSNGAALAHLLRQAGCELIESSRCPDDEAALLRSLERGLEGDLLCVVGGMSKGSHDLVPGALETLGVSWLVRSLDLKPGKPTRIGRHPAGCWVIGLPGNPVSCAVCFMLFAQAIIDGLSGRPIRRPRHLFGRLDGEMPANGARPLYQPAEWRIAEDGASTIRPAAWRGSGDPFGLATANALLYRPQRVERTDRGAIVPFIPIECPQ